MTRRRSLTVQRVLALTALLVLPATLATAAAPAELDAGFGTAGKVRISIALSDAAQAVAVQPDGKVILAGGSYDGTPQQKFAVVRLQASGALDPTFGNSGKATVAVGPTQDYARAVLLQPNGRIVAVGESTNAGAGDFGLARFMDDGSLDNGFGTNGHTATNLGGTDLAYGAALQADGKIIATGLVESGGDYQIGVVRYNADGSVDTDFGTAGHTLIDIGDGTDYGFAATIQSDGKIVLVGGATNGGNEDIAVVRLTTTGAPDPTFDTDGIVTTPVGTGTDEAIAVTLQTDGKILVAGRTLDAGLASFALLRYNADGSPDLSFDTDGQTTTDLGHAHEGARGVTVQTNGKIVVVGPTSVIGQSDFAVARFTTTGQLDTTFNGTGKLAVAVGPGIDSPTGVALQPNGMIVVGGAVHDGSRWQMGAIRVTGDADTVAPTNPTLTSPSHTVGATSADHTVDVGLAGASDNATGIAGYSTSWTTGATDQPDTTIDAAGGTLSLTSPTLADGAWYLHLRTVDGAGNWSAASHLGPITIATPDTTTTGTGTGTGTTGGTGTGDPIVDTTPKPTPPRIYVGTARADTYRGQAGNDRLSGQGGNDRLFGLAGNDILNGGIGNDWLSGDDGNDTIVGGAGRDTLLGGRGADILNARDGKPGDVIRCGLGRDLARIDRRDIVAKDCERIRYS